MAHGDTRPHDNDTGDLPQVSWMSVWQNTPSPEGVMTSTSDPYDYKRMYVLRESKLYVCEDWTIEHPVWLEVKQGA